MHSVGLEDKFDFPGESVIASLLSGKGFGNSTLYSTEESRRVKKDIQEIVQTLFVSSFTRSHEIILSVGPSSDEKRDDLQKLATNEGAAYLSPDALLKRFTRTYQHDLSIAKHVGGINPKITQQTAEQKWRPPAHAAAYILLDLLVKQGCMIVWQSTTPALLRSPYLKASDYRVSLRYYTIYEKQDLSLGKMGPFFYLYVDRIEFYSFTKKGRSLMALFARIGFSDQFSIFAGKEEKEKIRTCYNILAALEGFPRWEELVKGHIHFEDQKAITSPNALKI